MSVINYWYSVWLLEGHCERCTQENNGYKQGFRAHVKIYVLIK